MTPPFLDLTAPGFSTRGPEVIAARAAHWCARTPLGFAVLRHAQAGRLLRDRRLRQGSYAWPRKMGLTGTFASFWSRSVISLEGPQHKAIRQIALAALTPDWITTLIPAFEDTASALADALPDPTEFIHDFTEPFAGRAITTLLGLPASQSAWIASDASDLGLAMGLDCRRHQPRFNAATERLGQLADRLLDDPPAQSLVQRMLAHADDTPRETLRDLIIISIFGGVDTTRAQLGFALALFAKHPQQWTWLRQNPGLIPNAIEEVIRARPTTTWATRESVEDIEFQGVTIPAGSTVHLLVHAGATDPLVTPGWEFDIRAKRKIHFGFGGGAHHCLGQMVARTDMAAALRILADRFTQVSFAEAPEYLPDSGNTSPAKMPLRFTRA